MGIYDGIYLYMDLDGTLLNDRKTIPEANMRAMEKFTANGGRLGIATGRSAHNLSFFPNVLPLNAPSIIDNGGVLYDVKECRYIHSTYIPRQRSMEAITEILAISPDANIQIYTEQARYQSNLNPNRFVDPLVPLEGICEPLCRMEDIQGGWIKIVVCQTEEKLHHILSRLDMDALKRDFSVVLSGKIYFEFLSRGMNKGEGIKTIRKTQPDIKKILAIGDYYNDMEMLLQADISAAPANAEDDIKAVVNYITCDNNQGAVADFLRMALGMEI